jgi:hypothetical protein
MMGRRYIINADGVSSCYVVKEYPGCPLEHKVDIKYAKRGLILVSMEVDQLIAFPRLMQTHESCADQCSVRITLTAP